MVHSRHTRTSNSQTPIMCQTWHCGTQLCSQPPPLVGPEVALDIAIHHVHITPEKKLEFQRTIQDDPLLCTLVETIVAGWPEDIKDVPKALHPYHNHHDIMTVEDGLILKEKLSLFHHWKGRKYYKLYTKDTWESPSASTMQDNVYIGLESMKPSGKWLKHAQHANVTDHRNQDSHSNQHQHQNAHGNTLVLTTFHSMDLNTW